MKPWIRVVGLLLCVWQAGVLAAFDDGRAEVNVRVGDLQVPYRVFAWFAMPGEAVPITLPSPDFALLAGAGELRASGDGWLWKHHKPGGPYVLKVMQHGRELMRLNMFIKTPARQVRADGQLDGYRIGKYPERPLKGLSIYKVPPGFVAVTPENADTRISPHFTLGQFVSKQGRRIPGYLVLRPRLLLKLELVLQVLNAHGVQADRLTIMSGYRTPFYNHAIGNVKYSRHVWGGAADVYVDVSPRDGIMDDLNGDGRSDLEDARWLARLVDQRFREPDASHLAGGLAAYRANAAHGPFVHMDVRGTRARW